MLILFLIFEIKYVPAVYPNLILGFSKAVPAILDRLKLVLTPSLWFDELLV
jgi:hypothetical protein